MFTRMHFDSSGDCLKVYDSDTADPYQLAAQFCGEFPSSNQPTVPGKLVLHSGKVHFEWTTYRMTRDGAGFSATWSFTEPEAGRSMHAARSLHHGFCHQP
jgi:hypothetical protein